MSGDAARPGHVLLGLARLARFRADGIEQFGSTPQHFLNSLAPLVALPLVGSVLMALRGQARAGLSDFLATLVALLVPPVISHLLATRWQREPGWMRYAVAFNWCQWVVPIVLLLAMVVFQGFVVLGLSMEAAVQTALIGVLLYALCLHWFLARTALQIGRGRAMLLTMATDFGTALLVLVPLIADLGFNVGHDG